MVHVCEGAVMYPVGWVKMVTLLCASWLLCVT